MSVLFVEITPELVLLKTSSEEFNTVGVKTSYSLGASLSLQSKKMTDCTNDLCDFVSSDGTVTQHFAAAGSQPVARHHLLRFPPSFPLHLQGLSAHLLPW